mgnify:CR=1 FL=1
MYNKNMNLQKITPFMLKNQPDQTSYLLNQMIDKVNTGNIAKASSGGSATLYPTTGQNTDGAMTQKATTDALNTKANSSDVNVALQNKVDKVAGKGLSENDFTDALKTKLENLDPSGEENVIEKIQKNGSDLPISNKTVNVTVPTKTSDLTNNSNFVSDANYVHTDNNYTSSDKSDVAEIDGIVSKIPAQASSSNQLADKAFVNSSVQTATANFRGNWASWSAVPTNASLYPVDYAGSHTPTVNDYLVVQDASGYTEETLEGTWRFKYSGTWATDGKNGWNPEYQVNETPLTAAQLAALNSGITSAAVTKLSGIQAGAEVNVQTDWNQTDTSADDYLKNKPTLGSLASKNEVQTGDIADGAVTYDKAADDMARRFVYTTGYKRVNIPNNSDLNSVDFCSINHYCCSTNAAAQTLTNCPTEKGFWMDVYARDNNLSITASSKNVYLIRRITDLHGEEWIQRVYINGSSVFEYNSWKKIVNTGSSNIISTAMVADNAVTSEKIVDGAVTADKIDFSTMDTGWITLNDQIKYRKIMNIVFVNGYTNGGVTIPADSHYTLIGTLPVGYRPNNIPFRGNINKLALPIGREMLQIATNGQISIYNHSSSEPFSSWTFYVSFIAD